MRSFTFGFLFLLLVSSIAAATPKLADLQISCSSAEQCKVVLALTSTAKYQTLMLTNPLRLVVNLYHTDLATDIDTVIDNSLIKAIRYSSDLKTNNLRLIFDLNKAINIKTMSIKSPNSTMFSLVLGLSAKAAATESSTSQVNTNSQPIPKITVPQQTNLRDIIIVVDPGHGGHDPGAIGPNHMREKDVVLAISKDLVNQINSQKGYKAVLTRDGDYFIPLRGRLKIARENHADMFVAVHADFYHDPNARGATVFALSLRGATSEAARYLAKKENESELGHVIADKDQVLQSVLINLTQSASITSSLAIGTDIMQNLNDITNLHHHKIDQAAFVVLKEPEIPSLLIETGFISNIEEEKLLTNSKYQQRIAAAIATGIKTYFNEKPPLGTLIAAK